MKPPPPSAIGLFIWALWIFWGFGYETVWRRFTTEVSGVIVSSKDLPSTGSPRYSTEYVIRDTAGRDHSYVAGATDASLERSLRVGSRISKQWGRLDYNVDGKTVRFPTYPYSAVLGVAVFCLLWGAVQCRSSYDSKTHIPS
jgi:hypothetical protein